MGYFRCNADLYLLPIMREVTKPMHLKDGFMPARESILIKMLSYCASGYEFYDAKHFSKVTMSPPKQCEIVWNVCLEQNVLRESKFGYSVTEWLKERGLLGVRKERHSAPQPAASEVADDHTDEVKSEACEGTCGQREASAESERADEDVTSSDDEVKTHEIRPVEQNDFKPSRSAAQNRTAVRPNIWLSNDEVMLLKKKYSDDDIAYMVDYYSDWKRKKGEDIRISDYQAIERWVYRVLARKPSSTQTMAEMPDWVHGGTKNESKRSGDAN